MHATTDPANDPFNLHRFVQAQQTDYSRALAEIRGGRKRSHWMWYIFPQLDGLGFSSTARFYSLKSLDEAKAFLSHPLLGPRLLEITEALLALENLTAHEIFGSPDDLKLRSCATLFAQLQPPGSAFDRLLAKYYRGESDPRTLDLLNG